MKMSGSKESVTSDASKASDGNKEETETTKNVDGISGSELRISTSASAGLERVPPQPPPHPPLSKLAATMPQPSTNLRTIRSHPNMLASSTNAAKTNSRPATTAGIVGTSSSLKTLSAASVTSNLSSNGVSGAGCGSVERQSSPSNADVDEVLGEDEGGHDTITSLAGAKMLQKYNRYTSHLGAAGSGTSLDKNSRLEQLFHDITEEDELAAAGEDEGAGLPESGFLPQSDAEKHQEVTDERGLGDEEEEFVPPDGGYGWFVVLGAFFSVFWCSGFIKSYGLIFAELLRMFPDSSVSLATWIPASMTSFALVVAPIAGALCKRFNCRVVTLAGGLISSASISLSAAAPSMEFIFVTMGVFSGLGIGLSTTPGVILAARYFERNRAIANALCISGAAAGSSTMPFLIQYLLQTYGFRGAVLIMGACMLHIGVSAALFRPISVHVAIQRRAWRGSEAAAAGRHSSRRGAARTESMMSKESCAGAIHHVNSSASLGSEGRAAAAAAAQQIQCRWQHHHHPPHPNHHPLIRHHSNQSSQSSRLFLGPEDTAAFDYISRASSMCSLCSSHRNFKTTGVGSEVPSSLASRESLYWADIEQDRCGSPMRTLSPLRELRYPYPEESVNAFCSDPHILNQKARGLTLRELALHQIGSKINVYKSTFLRGGSTRSPGCSRNGTSGCLPKNMSFSSVRSTRRRHFRDESTDKDLQAPDVKTEQKALKGNRGKATSSVRSSRFSLMFSLEDLATDSMSVLKDDMSRRTSGVGSKNCPVRRGRAVQLDRSVSCVTKVPAKVPELTRTRYLSEGHGEEGRRQFSLKGSRFKLIPTVITDAKGDGREESKDVGGRDGDGVNEGLLSEKSREKDPKSMESASTIIDKVKEMVGACFDPDVLRDPVFLLVTGCVCCMTVGSPHLLFFLPAYADQIDVHPASVSLLLSVCSVFDLVGRIGFGLVLDARIVNPNLVFSAVMFASTAAVFAVPNCHDVLALGAAVSVYAVGTGTWFLMIPLLLTEYLGVERIGASYGMVRFFQAGANLLGPILAGYLWEASGTLEASFYYMAAMMTVGSFASLLLSVSVRLSQRKRNTREQQDAFQNHEEPRT